MQATINLSPQRRFALTVVVMALTLMQVLDSTIANVALPHMQAALGATPESIAWVLTSYIVASAIAVPLTGWLEARIGRYKLIISTVIGFTFASALCGMAVSLPMMVSARFFQGICGAFISPLTQATMLDIYPSDQRAKALTIWAMGVMIGPIVGPVLGGILTDAYSWRWIFFINLPVGVLTLIGTMVLLPRIRQTPLRFDMIGFVFLVTGLGALQLMLDRGTQLDWFESPEIIAEAGICVAMFWLFGVHTATAREPIIPRELFRDRNFMLANLFLLGVMAVLMTAAALIPPMLQALLGYNTIDAGLVIVPRGLTMLLSMAIVGRLADRIDIRLLIGAGMIAIVAAQWIMTGFTLDMDRTPIILSGLLQGIGFGFVLMPLNLTAFATIPAHVRTSAASVYNLTRNIGGSIGISLFSALLAHNLQVSHSDLVSKVSTTRFPFLVAGLIEKLGASTQIALRMLDMEINRQAMMIAYLDDFWLMGMISFVTIPLVIFFKPRKAEAAEREMMVME